MKPDSPVTTIIMERSLDADRAIFAQMLRDDGLLETCEFDIYKRIAQDAMDMFSADGILWLTVSPELCFERVGVRGREGENKITLDYLVKCDSYHKQWLGADTGFVFQVEDSKSSDHLFWSQVDLYVLWD